jgi:hypothetical protein
MTTFMSLSLGTTPDPASLLAIHAQDDQPARGDTFMTHGAILLVTKSTSCYVEALASAALVALVLQEWKVHFMV